jgi:hypothetical protein
MREKLDLSFPRSVSKQDRGAKRVDFVPSAAFSYRFLKRWGS